MQRKKRRFKKCQKLKLNKKKSKSRPLRLKKRKSLPRSLLKRKLLFVKQDLLKRKKKPPQKERDQHPELRSEWSSSNHFLRHHFIPHFLLFVFLLTEWNMPLSCLIVEFSTAEFTSYKIWFVRVAHLLKFLHSSLSTRTALFYDSIGFQHLSKLFTLRFPFGKLWFASFAYSHSSRSKFTFGLRVHHTFRFGGSLLCTR